MKLHSPFRFAITFTTSAASSESFGREEASKLTYLGLYALQHRGQESAGIASSDGNSLEFYKVDGLGAGNLHA